MNAEYLRVDQTLIDRFWQKVDKNGPVVRPELDNCWNWLAGKSNGYGIIRFTRLRKQIAAHRLSWIIHNGPVRDGMLICHHCDNPSCCRPNHLFEGTIADNSKDMARKLRGNHGKRHHGTKLDSMTVVSMKSLYRSGSETVATLAAQLHMSKATIKNIVTGRSWKYIP